MSLTSSLLLKLQAMGEEMICASKIIAGAA